MYIYPANKFADKHTPRFNIRPVEHWKKRQNYPELVEKIRPQKLFKCKNE